MKALDALRREKLLGIILTAARVNNYSILVKNYFIRHVIKNIKNFGIFKKYSNVEVKDFARFNLFYGLNASGKTTLSYLFQCIENKTLPEKLSSSEFSVTLADESTITNSNVSKSILDIYTFNDELIKKISHGMV